MITESARAKLNLSLDILGTREDGFHEVAMILQAITLADRLSIERTTNNAINLTLDANNVEGGEFLPTDDKNLAVQAAQLMFDRFNLDGGLHIRLEKNIPIAAGLGGGSADAAAVLRAINRLFELKLSSEELCALGAEIGSDVPFCVVGGTCLAEGRGERLEQLPDIPSIPIVLIKPRGSVPTAWAYKTYDSDPSPEHPDTIQLVEAIKLSDVEAVGELIFNVLERVAVKMHPSVIRYKTRLLELGASAAMMSGSGPTVFGLAHSRDEVKRIAHALDDPDCNIFITETAGKYHVQ